MNRGQHYRQQLGIAFFQARQQRGLSIRDAAKRADMSASYWCEVERARKQVSFDVLDMMCAALDISLAHVLSYMTREEASV